LGKEDAVLGRLRLLLAILVARAVAFLARLAGHRGSSLPGMVGLRLCPQAPAWLARDIRGHRVIVTGTNGKTTTANMLRTILTEAGYRVVANREGANLMTGVATCLLRAAGWRGRLDHDYAVLEADEAAFPAIAAGVRPSVVVITNFFRDQLDRYGELDRTVRLIADALVRLEGVTLVLNADDPLVAQLARLTGHPAVFYGLAPVEGHRTGQVREARYCPFCRGRLGYEGYVFGQLGRYRCACGFVRPGADFEGLPEHGALTVCHSGGCLEVTPGTTGFYNTYNALAAFAAARVLDIPVEVIQKALAAYRPATGRMEEFRYGSKKVILNLVKNPAGFNETLVALLETQGTKDVFIAINDLVADGRDVSWLWDADCEALAGRGDCRRFVCSGRRGADMAVRLKYAGVPVDRISVAPSLKAGIRATLAGDGEAAFFLATYTALWPVERLLRRELRGDRARAHRMPSVS
jgi:UDP-N-acetylmuramyl tripeptide synthase